MKTVSIKSNAYADYIGFVGAERINSFPTEWAALEWLQEQCAKGHKINKSSKYDMADVEQHTHEFVIRIKG